MTAQIVATFALASFFIVIVPGPTVTVIVANSLRAGVRAGLMNVFGTQLGILTMMLIVATGLETVIAVMGQAFHWVKLAGAAYLIWLGARLLMASGRIEKAQGVLRSDTGYFWQGFIVIWSNPKALLLFGAFIPQFIEPEHAFMQTLTLGVTFMVVATLFDSLYAFAASGAGNFLNRTRVRMIERISGLFLIAGGIWMATLRRA